MNQLLNEIQSELDCIELEIRKRNYASALQALQMLNGYVKSRIQPAPAVKPAEELVAV